MRSVLAIVLLVILMPSFAILTLATSIQANVLHPAFLKTTLAQSGVYDLALETASKQLESVRLENNPLISSTDLQTLGATVITTEWLQPSVEQIIDQAFLWFNAPADATLKLPIDLRDPKQRLQQEGEQLINKKIAAFPKCPLRPKPDELCRPANATTESVKKELEKSGFGVTTIVARIPNEIDLAQVEDLGTILAGTTNQPATDSALMKTLQPAKNGYAEARQILRYAWIGFGVLVALYLALILRGWRRTIRWSGILALCIGITPLVIGLMSRSVLTGTLLPNLHISGDLPPGTQRAIEQIALHSQNALFHPLFIVGLILILTGITDIVASFFLPKSNKKFHPAALGKGVNFTKPAFSK